MAVKIESAEITWVNSIDHHFLSSQFIGKSVCGKQVTQLRVPVCLHPVKCPRTLQLEVVHVEKF